MEKEVKEVTVEELKKLIQSQEGEFIIRVEPGEGDADGKTESVSASTPPPRTKAQAPSPLQQSHCTSH